MASPRSSLHLFSRCRVIYLPLYLLVQIWLLFHCSFTIHMCYLRVYNFRSSVAERHVHYEHIPTENYGRDAIPDLDDYVLNDRATYADVPVEDYGRDAISGNVHQARHDGAFNSDNVNKWLDDYRWKTVSHQPSGATQLSEQKPEPTFTNDPVTYTSVLPQSVKGEQAIQNTTLVGKSTIPVIVMPTSERFPDEKQYNKASKTSYFESAPYKTRKENIYMDDRPSYKEDDDEYIGANLKFYRNHIPFRPNGEYIENVHKFWIRDYKLLENLHTFIQWLFPIAESSRVNPDAVPLRSHEAKYIYDDNETRQRVFVSYQLMLDFFGMTLTDCNTGQVNRARNWKERFYHWQRSSHNFSRITRILKSLGQLGFLYLQAPLVMFLLHEVLETRELSHVPTASVQHWLRAVNNDYDRNYVTRQFQESLEVRKHEETKQHRNTTKRQTFQDFKASNKLINWKRLKSIDTSKQKQMFFIT